MGTHILVRCPLITYVMIMLSRGVQVVVGVAFETQSERTKAEAKGGPYTNVQSVGRHAPAKIITQENRLE